MDADIRDLERAAATGDDDARARLWRAWQRAGRVPPDGPRWTRDELDACMHRIDSAVQEWFWADGLRGYSGRSLEVDLPCEPNHVRFVSSPDEALRPRMFERVRFNEVRVRCRCGAEFLWFRQAGWQGPERDLMCGCGGGSAGRGWAPGWAPTVDRFAERWIARGGMPPTLLITRTGFRFILRCTGSDGSLAGRYEGWQA